MNGALGAALMGDAPIGSETGAVKEAIMRVLDAQVSLTKKVAQQSADKEKLAQKIRKLEKEAVQGGARAAK